MKHSRLSIVLIATGSPGSALAHGGGCSEPQWAVNLYMALGAVCAILAIASLIFGLFAIRGRLWWQLVTKSILLAGFLALSGLYFFLNLGFLMTCSGNTFLMMALNAAPATFISLAALGFKKLGNGRFA